MNRRLIAVALVIAAQCVWLLGMTYKQERILTKGVTVLLETQPVDPRDLLRGDYVILSYKISNVPLSLFQGMTNSLSEGATVFVRLERQGEFHVPVAAYTQAPPPQPETVVIKGTIAHWWQNGGGTARVHYGLEKYFVPEGTGNPVGRLTVEASVTKAGGAAIRQVFVDGQPYSEAMRAQMKTNRIR